MDKKAEISSTEKLLQLIRNDAEPAGPSPTPAPPPLPKEPKRVSRRRAPSVKAVSVGVDIGYQDVRMVKVAQSADRTWSLLDYLEVPFDRQVPRDSSEFPLFLRSALSGFCGSSRNLMVWTLISAASVEIQHLRIPKVPRKQIPNAVQWTFKRESTLGEEETILDFEIQGDITERGIQKTAVMAYAAPSKEIQEIRDLFSKSGFPLAGITVAPFAVQNLFRTQWIATAEETVCNLYIGRDWSHIDIFSGGNLVLTRGIKAGINSMAATIMDTLNAGTEGEPLARTDVQDMVMTEGSRMAGPVDMEEARKFLFSLSPKSPRLGERDPGFGLSEAEIFQMILPAVDRLISQVDRTFEYYASNLEEAGVGKIYISGGIDGYQNLIDHIGNELGLPIGIIDPLSQEIPYVGQVSTPKTIPERAAFSPATGLALSDNSHTPSFLFTFKEKDKLSRIGRFNQFILLAFLLCAAVCLGIFFWQGEVAKQKQAQTDQVRQELAQYNPKVDQNFILQMAAQIKKKRQDLKALSRRHEASAIIGELTELTPDNIRLLSISTQLGRVLDEKIEPSKKRVVLEGLVSGSRYMLETSLTGYLLALANSPLFRRPTINKTRLESSEKGAALYFTLHLQVL